jgi:hypothetical protein
MMQLPIKALSVLSLLCATIGTVQAQYSDGVIRIGVLNGSVGPLCGPDRARLGLGGDEGWMMTSLTPIAPYKSFGTKLPIRDVRASVAIGGKADARFPLMQTTRLTLRGLATLTEHFWILVGPDKPMSVQTGLAYAIEKYGMVQRGCGLSLH